MTLTIVRHSYTAFNEAQKIQGRIDIPLSANGILHAKKMFKNVFIKDLDIIAASPLVRATQTAKIASEAFHYDQSIVMVHSFIERDFGELDDTFIKDSRPKLHHPEKIRGYEMNDTFEKRIVQGLKMLYKHYPNKHIFLVCHSHVIKGLLTISKNFEADYLKTKIDHQTLLKCVYDNHTLNYVESTTMSL